MSPSRHKLLRYIPRGIIHRSRSRFLQRAAKLHLALRYQVVAISEIDPYGNNRQYSYIYLMLMSSTVAKPRTSMLFFPVLMCCRGYRNCGTTVNCRCSRRESTLYSQLVWKVHDSRQRGRCLLVDLHPIMLCSQGVAGLHHASARSQDQGLPHTLQAAGHATGSLG